MRAPALAFAGSLLLATLPAAAQTPPAPPVTVVVVPGGAPAAPPPGYAPPPGPYYAPAPPGYVPAPPVYAPPAPYYGPAYPVLPAMERRSVGAMAAGIVGVSAGGILLFSSLFAALITDANCAATADVAGSCSNSNQGVAIALGVSGGVAIAIGIPLIVWGARKVPVGTVAAGNLPSPLPAWAGAPGGPGWRWRF
jgi:hypothetical protein